MLDLHDYLITTITHLRNVAFQLAPYILDTIDHGTVGWSPQNYVSMSFGPLYDHRLFHEPSFLPALDKNIFCCVLELRKRWPTLLKQFASGIGQLAEHFGARILLTTALLRTSHCDMVQVFLTYCDGSLLDVSTNSSSSTPISFRSSRSLARDIPSISR